MLWFWPYQFDYPSLPQQAQPRLLNTLAQHGLHVSESGGALHITRPLGALFRNSWNPVFVARLSGEGAHTRLRGHFRVHAAVLLFSVAFLAMQLWWLWGAFQQPELRPGYEPGWRAQQIRFYLEFMAMFFGVTALGWLAGLPNARRILAALREGALPR